MAVADIMTQLNIRMIMGLIIPQERHEIIISLLFLY